MKVQLTRDLALPLAKKGKEFRVELKTTGKDGEPIYFVHYYGNTIAFPADACEEVGLAAADLIENQQRHIEALMQANDALRGAWVPVTERLPEPTVCVLAAYSSGVVEVDAWGRDGWMGENLSNGAITHWMPLPEAPET